MMFKDVLNNHYLRAVALLMQPRGKVLHWLYLQFTSRTLGCAVDLLASAYFKFQKRLLKLPWNECKQLGAKKIVSKDQFFQMEAKKII